MNWLTQWRLRFHDTLLQKELRGRRCKRYSMPFEEMEQVGLFFDATQLDEREAALDYAAQLKKAGKKVSLLGFFDNKLDNPNFTFPYFNRKDLDWALRPKKDVVQQFLDKDFDLLLLAVTRSTFLSEYLGALSRAHMRVGPVTEHTYAYDLMIDGGPDLPLDSFFRQAESVLKLNTRQYEKAKV